MSEDLERLIASLNETNIEELMKSVSEPNIEELMKDYLESEIKTLELLDFKDSKNSDSPGSE